MGKKLKVGKTRKDKFYHLAKETGYRSRSSFKLIQLNRKFQFLQRARALVDLCAAPGGWLQVASKFMPVSSLIIGVDLVPIRPIPNVVMLQEDITTEKCRQALRKELQTWKVDVVLNDGAPNVGANWSHDAFSQANLTLMALKLACEFLTKGGTFITKVFRSKDYQPLMWIFQQFFKKVQATKPQASRNESAEIFVVCQGFLAPDKIDNKFFDPKHAFKEVDVQVKSVNELVSKKKPKAEGYSDGDLTLYHTFSVTEFLKAENPVDFLSKANEITFNNPELESHPITSPEIRECCCDIKVLGRKELRLLLSWRSKLRRFLAKKLRQDAKQLDQEMSSNDDNSDIDEKESKRKGGEQKDEENAADGEEEEMEKKLAEMKAEEFAELKRKKKKLLKEKRKQRERVELKMDLPGVSIAETSDSSMFSLSAIKKAQGLSEITQGDMKGADALVDEEEADDLHISADEDEDERMSLASDLDSDDLEEIEKKEKEIEEKMPKKKKCGSFSFLLWNTFSLDIFAELDLDDDTDALSELKQTQLLQTGKGKKRKVEEEAGPAVQKQEVAAPSQEVNADDDNSDSDDDNKRVRILNAEGLALGTQIATSKKRARDLIDGSFHRFANSEDMTEVPAWLVDDEKKHRKRPVPITKEMVEEYKQKWREINARPVRRVAEAKARKKRRMLKKMEQAKKKAEAVVDTVDISEREKMAQLKSIYKKAGVGKEKRDITYIVAKKGVGRRVHRPAGVKGTFRVVDGRLKKDTRAAQRKEQRGRVKKNHEWGVTGVFYVVE
uniref:pre-rRNA processing protein FTSJ3 n=1 Tax=Sinocyclocheilus anshuiensis TaxID=1608454 RepID=A0A671MVE2_9TELE